MKIYRISDDSVEKKPRKNSEEPTFARKKTHVNDESENVEEFVSYDDFYEKNGRDVPFGGGISTRKNSKISPAEYYDNMKKRREKLAKKRAAGEKLRADLAQNVGDKFEITKIAPAVKIAGRYNVFVDDDFALSLDEIQLVDAKIKKGDFLTPEQYLNLKSASDFGKNYMRALDLISRRMHSEKEIRDYGFRKKWSKNDTEKVVERLHDRGYLNDEKFAQNFVATRAKLQNFSRRKMEIELMKRGIDKEIRDKVLRENDEFDEQNSLNKLVAKKIGRYEDERKFISYLMRQGFNYGDIRDAIALFHSESE